MSNAVSKKTYAWIWLALLGLLLGTWGASRVDLGSFNTALSLLIACVKMALIILFFMHVRHSRAVVWVFVGAGFLWLLIFLDLTLSDYLTRGFSWSQ